MKHVRLFNSLSEMDFTMLRSSIDILGMAYDNGEPVLRLMTFTPPPIIMRYGTQQVTENLST